MLVLRQIKDKFKFKEKCHRRPNSRAQRNYWTRTDRRKTHGKRYLNRFHRLWTLLMKILIFHPRSKKLLQIKKEHASDSRVRKMIYSKNSTKSTLKNGIRSLQISRVKRNYSYAVGGLQNTIQTTNIVSGLLKKIKSS